MVGRLVETRAHAPLKAFPAIGLAHVKACPRAAQSRLNTYRPRVKAAGCPLVVAQCTERRYSEPHPEKEPTVWPGGFQNKYKVGQLLGRGSFGAAYLATERLSGVQLAVKIVSKCRPGKTSEEVVNAVQHEVELLRRMQVADEVVRLYGVYEDTHQIYLVTELCHGGSLQTVLDLYGSMCERDAAKVLFDIISVLEECHAQNICYSDVKPSNFLLKSPYVRPETYLWEDAEAHLAVKLIDFGCSQTVVDGKKLRPTGGSPLYVPPELFSQYFGVESDMWSVGILLYQLLSNRLPFWTSLRNLTPPVLRAGILNNPVNFEGGKWEGISDSAKNLILRLLERDYTKRITASEALEHPFLQQLLCSDEEEACRAIFENWSFPAGRS